MADEGRARRSRARRHRSPAGGLPPGLDQTPVRWRDAIGVSPAGEAWAAARRALGGDPTAPGVRFDRTSLGQFKARISVPTWTKRPLPDGRVPVLNLFNRVRPPEGSPYSVRITHCRDFLGGQRTYDSHAGTDFASHVGTPVVAGAPGLVVRVAQEWDRGGRDVMVDHGQGLVTTHSHLARTYVVEGQSVARGEVLGLSGAAGLEFLLFFPFIAPHLHYNTWVDGVAADPFAVTADGETSLWRTGNDPVPHDGSSVEGDADVSPSAWDEDVVSAHVDLISVVAERDRIGALEPGWRRGAEVLWCREMRAPMFTGTGPALFAEPGGRRAVLDLPYRREEIAGIRLPGAAPIP
ncbi:MAG: M23 family metallopeptidase [Acidimicrobiales bacterium]|nr:M23 family metallopeptidase [Acidimicrobiales bacterium]